MLLDFNLAEDVKHRDGAEGLPRQPLRGPAHPTVLRNREVNPIGALVIRFSLPTISLPFPFVEDSTFTQFSFDAMPPACNH